MGGIEWEVRCSGSHRQGWEKVVEEVKSFRHGREMAPSSQLLGSRRHCREESRASHGCNSLSNHEGEQVT